jgi:flagellar basal-body rod protein FlgB
MPSSLDKTLDIPARALQLRSQRAEVLAANMANADTPYYKAMDFDFSAMLRDAANSGITLDTTNVSHIKSPASDPSNVELKYRLPYQSSMDGNTVETEVEQAQFAENAVQYQAAFTLLNGRIKSLLTAIKGD